MNLMLGKRGESKMMPNEILLLIFAAVIVIIIAIVVLWPWLKQIISSGVIEQTARQATRVS